MLKSPPPRKGFVPLENFYRLLKALPQHLRPLVTFLYYTGARKGEACAIRRDQVDLKAALVKLEAEQTKTSETRVIPLPDVLVEMLRQQEKDEQPQDGLAFDSSNLCKFWETACDAVGLGRIMPVDGRKYYHYSGLMIHELRRSGARNLRKAGVPESVCMKITGHKSRSVSDRPDIVDVEDVQQAMKRVEQAALPTVKTTRRLLNGEKPEFKDLDGGSTVGV